MALYAPPLLAALLLAPAAAQTTFEHWGQEAGNARRSNAIAYTGGAPAAGSGYVLVKDLGSHKLSVSGVWPTLPVFTPSGHVVVADVDNFLLALPPPEQVAPPDISAGPADPEFSYPSADVFLNSGAFVFGAPPSPSSSAAVGADGVAYWVSRPQNALYAVDTSGLAGGGRLTQLPWSPLNLTAAGAPGFRKYKGEFALLLHANRLWLPDPDQHSALVVDVELGGRGLAEGFAQPAHRLQGSVGGFAPLLGAESAAFTDVGAQPAGAGGIFGVQSLNPFDTSKETWRAQTPFPTISNDFQHPVSLEFVHGTGGRWSCVVASKFRAPNAALGFPRGGLQITGVSDATGAACGPSSGDPLLSWGTNDGEFPGTYTLANEYTANITWASAPAVVPDGGSTYRLYYALNLARPAQCVLYSVLVDYRGVFLGSSEGRRMGNILCNSAPVALLDAAGKGKHRIAILQDNGVLGIVDWLALHTLAVNVALRPFVKHPDGADGVVTFMGSYLALNSKGTLLAVAHAGKTSRAYLVAVVGAFRGRPPAPTPSGPSPSASPAPGPGGNSAVTDAGRPMDNLLAGLFGGVCVVGALAAVLVASFPDAPASRAIVSASKAAWGGAEALAARASDLALRGGRPATPLMMSPGSGAPDVGVRVGGGGGERSSLLGK